MVTPAAPEWAYRLEDVLKQVHEQAQGLHVPAGVPRWIVPTSCSESSLASRFKPKHDRGEGVWRAQRNQREKLSVFHCAKLPPYRGSFGLSCCALYLRFTPEAK